MSTVEREDVFEGVPGLWLKNDLVEAFVSGTPYPRVVAFRRRGADSPFRRPGADPFYGIRTWFLEPVQLKTAALPAIQPAEERRVDARSVRLTARPEPETRLQVVMECRVDETRPVLEIRHGLRNMAPDARRLAAWSIMVFPHAGVGCVPWAAAPTTVRSYLLFPGVSPAEPSLSADEAGLAVNFGIPPRKYIKVGSNSDAGWAAYLWNGQALVSRVPWVAGAEYPEGGGTVTFYNAGRTLDAGFCEVEHVGPLTGVAPGEVLWLEQSLEWRGEVRPAERTPAEWLKSVAPDA